MWSINWNFSTLSHSTLDFPLPESCWLDFNCFNILICIVVAAEEENEADLSESEQFEKASKVKG